jgi:hypothetical protein
MPKTFAKKLVLGFLLIPVASFHSSAQTAQDKAAPDNNRSQIVGTWRGNSVCMVENSPCRDESNVYHFSEISAKPGSFSVTASKLVDGKEIVMGTSEWKYDSQKHILEGETPGGTFRFTIESNRMEGTLTTKDNVVYRRIHLKKDH